MISTDTNPDAALPNIPTRKRKLPIGGYDDNIRPYGLRESSRRSKDRKGCESDFEMGLILSSFSDPLLED